MLYYIILELISDVISLQNVSFKCEDKEKWREGKSAAMEFISAEVHFHTVFQALRKMCYKNQIISPQSGDVTAMIIALGNKTV